MPDRGTIAQEPSVFEACDAATAFLKRSTQMRISLTVLWSLVAVSSGEGAIVTSPVEVSAHGFLSASYDLDRDGVDDLTFGGGGTICTHDIPVSGCTSRLAILGGDRIEFLLEPAIDNFGMALNDGFILNSDPVAGIWGGAPGGRFELGLRTSQRFPDREPFRPELMGLDHYLLGFRIRDSEESHRYGWINIQLQGDVIDLDGTVLGQWPTLYVTEFYLEELPDEPVTVVSVPEPRMCLFITIAFIALLGGRHRNGRPNWSNKTKNPMPETRPFIRKSRPHSTLAGGNGFS